MTDNDLRTTRRVRELKGEQRQSTPQQVLCTNLPLCPFPLPLSPVHVQSFNHSPCPFPPLPLSTRPSRGGCKCTCCNRPPPSSSSQYPRPPGSVCLPPSIKLPYQGHNHLHCGAAPSSLPLSIHPSVYLSTLSFFFIHTLVSNSALTIVQNAVLRYQHNGTC